MTSFQGVVCKPLSSSVKKHLYRSESGFMSKQENDQSATVKRNNMALMKTAQILKVNVSSVY